MTNQYLKDEIDQILAARQALLPQVGDAIEEVSEQSESVGRLLAVLSELSSLDHIDEDLQAIHRAVADVMRLLGSIEARVDGLKALQSRYSRPTINIGVSGEARVGKSTTLQKFSGLSDAQIPSGNGLPVTAVRSEVFNSTAGYADVTFRDQAAFIEQYVQPLLDVVNRAADLGIVIRSLSDLRHTDLPNHLGNNVDSVAADSLRRLQDAKTSLDSYAPYLTGRGERVGLDDLRRFVAYPTNEEITSQENGGGAASRAYIAVKAVKIYCAFPGLDGVKIGLVDLPGLGEIGEAVADMHLSGLEDGVDQILLIMRPSESEGYVKGGISSNIDQLRRIQPGIRRRADLITAGINVYDGHDQTAQSLEDDFRRRINAAQESDAIQVERYQAIDSDSVADLFDRLLAKISERLPVMDREVFDYVLGERDLQDDISRTLSQLSHTLNQVLRRIPLEERWLAGQIERVSKSLKDDYNRYEVELAAAANSAGEWSQGFEADVKRIHADTKARIDDGFFLGRSRWQDAARGQTDYYVFYREEARRLRREIIAQYSGLDEFYDDHVGRLKSKAVDILLDNTGDLQRAFGITESDDATSKIDKVASELGGSIQDDDLDSALALLNSVQFSFRHNVFLNISKHLEALANPPETHQVPMGIENIRIELGGISDIDTKTTKVSAYLAAIAHDANTGIRKALLASDDKFGEYLSVCMSFFIDYLYRKDDENFTHFVVRRLISVYRDLILTDAASMAGDQAKTALIARAKDAITDVLLSSPAGDGGNTPNQSRRQPRRAGAPTAREAPSAHVPAERDQAPIGPEAATDTAPPAAEAGRVTPSQQDPAGSAKPRGKTKSPAQAFRSNIAFDDAQ